MREQSPPQPGVRHLCIRVYTPELLQAWAKASFCGRYLVYAATAAAGSVSPYILCTHIFRSAFLFEDLSEEREGRGGQSRCDAMQSIFRPQSFTRGYRRLLRGQPGIVGRCLNWFHILDVVLYLGCIEHGCAVTSES